METTELHNDVVEQDIDESIVCSWHDCDSPAVFSLTFNGHPTGWEILRPCLTHLLDGIVHVMHHPNQAKFRSTQVRPKNYDLKRSD